VTPTNTHHTFASRRALIAGILATTALTFTACSQNDGAVTSQSAADTATMTQTDGNASNANSENRPNPTGSNSDAGGSNNGGAAGNSDDTSDDANSSETAPSQNGGQTNGDTETTSSSSSENADIGQAMRDIIYSNSSPGTTFTGGEEMTVCVYGDGYRTNLVVAGPNTSCEFATEVFHQQTDGLNATADNIRDNLKPNIQATSPATGQTYDVSCGTQGDGVVACSGGNDARIYIN